MATIVAQATGNWSAPGTWAGGVVPANAGDIAQTSNFNVTIDQDVNLGTGTLQATGSGAFLISTAHTITANIDHNGTSGAGALQCSHTTGTVTVNGNVTVTAGTANNKGISHASTGTLTLVGNITGGSASNAHGLSVTSSGPVNVTGNVTGGSSNTASGINNSSTSTVTVTGNVFGGTASTSRGIANSSTGTINVTGNVTGGGGTDSPGIINSGAGTVTVTGNVTGGSAATANYGISNTSTGTVTVTGTATGGVAAAGASNSAAGTMTVGTAVGNDYGPSGSSASSNVGVAGQSVNGEVTRVYAIQYGAHGQSPTSGAVKILPSTSLNIATFIRSDTGASLALTDPAATADFPNTGDVRNGTTYKNATMTGTLKVPAAGSVDLGVQVDAGTGTAVLSQQNVRDALKLAASAGSGAAGSIDARLPAALTADSNMKSDVLRINGDVNAAVRHALAAGQIIPFTVDTAGFAPTATEFETSTITEATSSHYNGTLIVWTTGALAGQRTPVTAYSLVGGRGHFTITANTSDAPANGDTGVLV